MQRCLLSIAMLAVICGVANADITTGLVAHYDFEAADVNASGDGTTIIDVSGPYTGEDGPQPVPESLDLTIENAGSQNAVVDSGDAARGQVYHGQGNQAGNSPIARRKDVFRPYDAGDDDGDGVEFRSATMAAWFKLRPQDAANVNLGDSQEFFTMTGARMAIYVRPPSDISDPVGNPDGLITQPEVFAFSQSGGNTWNPKATDETVGDVSFADDKWHHIAGTFNDDTKELRVYVDGTLRDQSTKPEVQWQNDIVISNQEESRGFGGYVDDLYFFNRALTPHDIAELAGTTIPEPASIAIVMIGLASLVGLRRRRRA